ncbi:MAG: hypothetical protein QOD70_2400, partial [Frankiales bacterium]|nr:hypothetical protein [Frankiales bacterium]
MAVVVDEAPQWVLEQQEAGPSSWVDPVEGEQAHWPPEEPGWEPTLFLVAQPSWDPPVRWAIPGVFGDPVSTQRPAPSGDVAAFALAVERLEATDTAQLSPEQALVDLGALLETQVQLRVVQLRRMHDADVRKLAALDDEPSLRSWVRRRLDDAPLDDTTVAKNLRPFVHLRSELQARRVSVEAAALAAKALGKVGRHVDRADGLIDGQPGAEVIAAVVRNVVSLVAGARLGLKDDDPLLVGLTVKVEEAVSGSGGDLGKLEMAFALMAEHIPLQHLKKALEQQVDALLPSELERLEERGAQSRGLRLDKSRWQGGGRAVVNADDELYELLDTCLRAELSRDEENQTDTEAKRELRERNPHGEILVDGDVEAEHDVRFPRTREQRLHDALKKVLHRHVAAGLAGSHDKAPVAVTVVVSAEMVEGRPGALPAQSGSGRSLPASLVRRWWCDAKVTALLVSKGLVPVGMTHGSRTLTAAE